ncbi:heptaprenyl diphosphate synthase component 1 [Tepidibacillus marianensis]|uniref:heptaprenyl diphosphate synthase component 1 n=1 Tax=Tepidibacillus marianensis TaxID=3131995 RepID=UPI0030CB1292
MTITHSSFHIETDEILSELKSNVDHMFIKKYVEIPEISSLRLQLLNLLLYQASFPRSLRKLYCVTTGLVQVGLDIHEEIVNQRQFSEKEIRSRQLSILAGDYYSGQYYSLLSKANLVDGVKKIALGIRDINIAKMKVYTENNGRGFETFDQLIETIKQKESVLYLQFLDQLETEDQKTFWKKLIEDMTFLSSLTEELKHHQISRHHISYLLVNFFANNGEKREIADTKPEWKTKVKKLHLKYDIHRKLQELIQNIYVDLDGRIHQTENMVIKNEIRSIFDQFHDSFQMQKNIIKDF